jgi:hypothetical protein
MGNGKLLREQNFAEIFGNSGATDGQGKRRFL